MSYKDPIKQKKYQREWRAKRRVSEFTLSINKLGGKCEKCGIDDIRVLQIDHISPRSVTKETLKGSALKAAIVGGYANTSNLQLLCANCHMIKTCEDLGWLRGVS